jgi:acetyl-CoA carboxylase biotin carboxyl carrier protein
MELSHDDVREILRIIDASDVEELRIEISGLSLHVRKTAGADAAGPTVTQPPSAHDRAAKPAPAGNGALVIPAPLLGTFYRAEAPGEPPLVEVGDRVSADSVVCLIEVMKLMNHIQAGVSGTVVEVLADNGALVEFGQPLFLLAADE